MTNTSHRALTGGCKCGAATYESTTLPDEMTNCHCLTCRKISGSPYLTFARFPTESLTFNSKNDALRTTIYTDIAARTHCAECGSPISMRYDFQPQIISIAAGSIDEESIEGELVKPTEHIFLSEKAAWFEIPDDGLKKFEKFPDGFGKKVEEWKKSSSTSDVRVGKET